MTKRHPRRTDEEWMNLIQECRSSGLSDKCWCEISNNAVERRAKSYVTGRKNFLFHDTVDGAKASAVVLSLVETAKANCLNIYQYLHILLLYMPDYKKEPAGIEQLMPWSSFIKERCSGVTDTEKETPENRGLSSFLCKF